MNLRNNKEKKEIRNEIINERKNLNHILVLGNQVKYVITADSVEVENEKLQKSRQIECTVEKIVITFLLKTNLFILLI